MEPVDAEEALTYAVSRGMVLLYLVVLAGLLLVLLGSPSGLVSVFWVNSLFRVLGFVATFVGSVALL